MTEIDLKHAPEQIERLIAALRSGAETEVIFAQDGKPAARLTAVWPRQRKPIRLGLAKGEFSLPDDFDADDEYIAKLFNGEIDD